MAGHPAGRAHGPARARAVTAADPGVISSAGGLGGVDTRVKCVAAQLPVADGATWLRSMRRNHEWLAYLERIEANARVVSR